MATTVVEKDNIIAKNNISDTNGLKIKPKKFRPLTLPQFERQQSQHEQAKQQQEAKQQQKAVTLQQYQMKQKNQLQQTKQQQQPKQPQQRPHGAVRRAKNTGPASARLTANISALMMAADEAKKSGKVLSFLRTMMESEMKVTWQICKVGLKYCDRKSEMKSHNAQLSTKERIDMDYGEEYISPVDLTLFILSECKRLNVANHEAFMCAMRVCSNERNPAAAQLVMNEFISSGLPRTQQIMGPYMKALCSAALRNPGDASDMQGMSAEERGTFVRAGVVAYWEYFHRHSVPREGFPLMDDREIYIGAARAYSILLVQGQRAAASCLMKVFQAMAQAGFEPDFAICRSVLSSALVAKCGSVINLMLQWFLVHFDYPLEDGAISEAINIAVRDNDAELGKLALKCREKSFRIRCATHGPPRGERGVIGDNGAVTYDYASLLSIAVCIYICTIYICTIYI
jgi:hypothetical protein